MKIQSFFRKQVVALLIAAVMLLQGAAVPIQAEEAQSPASFFYHIWAEKALVEGQNYGLFPFTWYQEEFMQSMSADKLQMLLQATSRKIDALGLDKKQTAAVPTVRGDVTRGAVMQQLYAVLAQYKWTDSVPIDQYQADEFMHTRGIVKGTGNGMQLDKLCTVEEAVVMAIRLVADTYAALGQGAKGVMWKVSHHNNTMYLFGSIHEGITDFYPVHPQVQAAFQQADELIVEINFSDEAEIALLQEQYTYRDGTTLKDHVSAATYDKAQQVFAKLNMPAAHMNVLQPWWLGSVLDTVANSHANKEADAVNVLAVDPYFMTMANANGKPIRQLEGGEFQGKLFNSLSTNYLEKYLNRTLDQILTSTSLEENKDWKRLSLMRQHWIAGEKENFTATYLDMQQVDDEELTRKLFGERDKDMAGKLSQLLEQAGQSTYFVVVGAGHLVLQDMIVDQLKQKGFDVQQLQY